MKKKQLFAVLLAGSMTVGMAPAAAFAAEDTGAGAAAAAEAQVTDENTDTADNTGDNAAADAEAQKQAEEQAAADAAAQAQAEAEAQAAAQAQAEAEAQAAAEAQKQAEEQAAAEEAADEKADKVVESAKELQDAINSAPDYTGALDAADVYDTAYKIKIGASFALENETIKIPSNRNIQIYGTENVTTTISRGTVTGDMFEIGANSVLSMTNNEGKETDTAGTIVIDGATSGSTVASGSIIKVNAGSRFVMTTGVTLTNNTATKGAAIYNDGGNVLFTGGVITSNKCDGGAVYSTGTISVKKGEGAADTEPSIAENTKADGTTQANIVLSGEGKIEVKGAVTDQVKLGFSVETPAADAQVITKADDLADADVYAAALKVLASQYEGDKTKFTVDRATGKLAAAKEPTPTPTTSAEPTKKPTATPTKKPTATPKPTKKPTATPAPVDVKWTGFQWTAHDSASVTLRTNVTGTCYYTWVERGSDGTSTTPKKEAITNKQAVSKDKNFTIYLNDLDTDNAVDLYFYIKPSKGTDSGIKKVKLDQSKRPAKGNGKHTPVTPDVKESVLKGLNSAMEFYPNTFYDFQVIGAGTTNSNPGEGDVKWEPLYWSTSANPSDNQKHSTWKIGSTKGISKQGTYNLYVFFQKWVYTGGQWTETDTIQSAVYQFSSVAITITPSGTGTPGSNGGADGQTGADPDATVTGAASATSANGGNGSKSKNAVSTADNSPIGTMSALAVASILAGGYVIVRRRKKDI